MPFSTIVVKLRLIKTNKKDKIRDQKNLLANFIFLKVVVSNIHDGFQTQIILHYKLILRQQSTV